MNRQAKIEVFVPRDAVIQLRDALHDIGAGRVGNYDHCASVTEVRGYWRPLENSSPYKGTIGEIEEGSECKLEMICPLALVQTAIAAIRAVHPYEEPLIFVIPLLDYQYDE